MPSQTLASHVWLSVAIRSRCVLSLLTSPWAAPSMVTLYFLRSRPVWPWQCKQSNHCQNIVLANAKIALKRRQQILASLGTSVLVHNIGTSRRLNEQEFTSAVWKLYGCMFRGDPLADFQRRSIEHVTLAAGGFLPLALLHVSRLRLSCLSVFFVLLMICSLLQLRQTTKLAGKTRIILGTVVSFVLWIGFTPRLGHSPLTTTLDAFDQASWFLHTLRLPRTCSWHCGGLCRRTNFRCNWSSPPCETYTDACWLPPPSDSGRPRPLRDWEFCWGFEARDSKEQKQLRIGNVLYFVAIKYATFALLAGGCATLEHPRGSPPESGRFRIWASAFMERLLLHPRCRLHTFNQGYLGQYSLKPTTFLLVRMELGGICPETGEWREYFNI